MIQPQRIDCVDVNVRNLDRSVQWYCDHLGLRRLYEVSGGGMVIGNENVNLALFQADDPDARPRGYDGKSVAIRMFGLQVSEDDFARLVEEFAGDDDLVWIDHPRYKSCITEDPDGNAFELIVPKGVAPFPAGDQSSIINRQS